jgi:hypothetical protein
MTLLSVRDSSITATTGFDDPTIFDRFGLPQTLAAESR